MRPVEPAADLICTLGECPRWHAGERALDFVDMAQRHLVDVPGLPETPFKG